MPFLRLKADLSQALAKAISDKELTASVLLKDLGTPPNPALGHVAFPCFKLSKKMGKDAQKIAKELCEKINLPHTFFQVAGPYLNAKFDVPHLCQELFKDVFGRAEKYGADDSVKGQKVLLEYCSPNIAKRLGFQHIRTILIGNVLSNVYAFLGAKPLRVNFVGDWGSQFARLLAAFELWGDASKVSEKDIRTSMDYLLELYVRFHKELETNPDLLKTANECLQRLEQQDPKTWALWKKIREISVASMDATLGRMGVKFDEIEGESLYIPAIQKTLEDVKKKANARLSEGAWIVEIEGISTPALVQKKDGTTLYLTRDIAAAISRKEKCNFDSMLYVVSEQQKLHFQLLFAVLKRMGYAWADQCEHVSFGTVLFGTEKMSTREGRVIFLDAILDEAKDLALKECTEKNPNLANKETVAEQIGIGAIIFGNLSNYRTRDFEFNWKSVLAFDGETGPYVQYSLVRCQSLLEKAGKQSKEVDLGKYTFATEEEQLLLALSRFRGALHLVKTDNEPFHLTNYLIDVAKSFNKFYYQLPVLQASEETQKRLRLQLVDATRIVISNGLRLLGIPCPAEM